MAEHNTLGAWGEQVARGYLLAQGYALSGENEKPAGVEIDIIATKDDRICFVEVKTRSNDYVDPLDAIDKRKRARMVRAADAWLQRYPDLPLTPQFDIIIVIGTPDTGYTLEHIPDAFFPTLKG